MRLITGIPNTRVNAGIERFLVSKWKVNSHEQEAHTHLTPHKVPYPEITTNSSKKIETEERLHTQMTFKRH